MRLKRLALMGMMILAVTASVQAAHYASLYVIPVAGHTNGVNGTSWVSDVAIYNFNATPLTVELLYIKGGFDPDNLLLVDSVPGSAVEIPAKGTRILKDLLAGVGGMDMTIGSLIIGSNDGRAFAVTSRAYSKDPAGNTIGQTVLPARDFIDSALGTTTKPATGYIPGIISDARHRTNLGFVAGASDLSATPLVVEFTVVGRDGATLGTRQFSIPIGTFRFLQFPVTTVAPTGFSEASVNVTILSGDGEVVPYASIIDNQTADAVFVLGELPPNMNTGAGAKSVAESIFHKALTQRIR